MLSSKNVEDKIRLCFVGPMLGSNPGWVTTQGEILADLFKKSGYKVWKTSSIPNRFLRLLDTVNSLITWRNYYDVAVISIFSGKAFIMADISSMIVQSLNKPIIFCLRGGNLPEFSKRNYHWVERVLSRADRIIAPSYYLAEFTSRFDKKAEIIPNILRIEEYPFRLREILNLKLLWMRTFHEIYYPEMAVEVLAEVKKTYPGVKLTMAGQEKGGLEAVQKIVRDKNLETEVRFAGFLDQEKKRKEFGSHDIFINTNRIDNMPVSVIEAAAFGLPVVATNVGGIPYLLKNNVTALLVDEGDIKSMADAVIRLFQHPYLASSLSLQGRILAESCAWENVFRSWENVLYSLK